MPFVSDERTNERTNETSNGSGDDDSTVSAVDQFARFPRRGGSGEGSLSQQPAASSALAIINHFHQSSVSACLSVFFAGSLAHLAAAAAASQPASPPAFACRANFSILESGRRRAMPATVGNSGGREMHHHQSDSSETFDSRK